MPWFRSRLILGLMLVPIAGGVLVSTAETSVSAAVSVPRASAPGTEAFRLAVWNQDLEWGSESTGPSYWSRVPVRATSTAWVERIKGRAPFAVHGPANTENHIAWLWDGTRSAASLLRSAPFDAGAGRAYTAYANAVLGRGTPATLFIEFVGASGRRLALVPQRSRALRVGRLTRVTATAVAPAGTVRARLLVSSNASAVGSTYWDAFAVDEHRGPEVYASTLSQRSAMFVPGHRVASTSGTSQVIVQGSKHGVSTESADAEPVYNGYRQGSPTHAAQMFGSVVRDGETYKMWFQVKHAQDPWSIWYSESSDGIAWRRGEKVLHDAQPGGVLLNPDQSDPSRRFLMMTVSGTMRMKPDRLPMPPFEVDYRTWYSADGRSWKPLSNGPAINFRDIAVVNWDPVNRYFVAMTKQASGVNRQLFVSYSRDFRTWSTPRRALRTDTRDLTTTDVYTTATFRSGEELVALPALYTASKVDGVDGPMRPYLATSRDGVHFERPTARTPSLPLGRSGSLDDGMITPASAPVVVGDRVRLYYGGWNGGHEESGRSPRIFFAEWERERFAALRVDGAYGSVATKPLLATGTRLTVNATVPDDGRLTVAVLDARTGNVVPGYESSRSTFVSGDSLAAPVRWGGRELGDLGRREVVLRFVATKESRLFAFQVA